MAEAFEQFATGGGNKQTSLTSKLQKSLNTLFEGIVLQLRLLKNLKFKQRCCIMRVLMVGEVYFSLFYSHTIYINSDLLAEAVNRSIHRPFPQQRYTSVSPWRHSRSRVRRHLSRSQLRVPVPKSFVRFYLHPID
jgi:hypothetical protein